jgi:hypothetical protein
MSSAPVVLRSIATTTVIVERSPPGSMHADSSASKLGDGVMAWS